MTGALYRSMLYVFLDISTVSRYLSTAKEFLQKEMLDYSVNLTCIERKILGLKSQDKVITQEVARLLIGPNL